MEESKLLELGFKNTSHTDEEKNSFKILPNFDADVFEDITGIKI